MRLAIPLAIAILAAVLLAGCGGSSSSEGSTSPSSGPAQTGSGTSPKGSAPGAPIGASARNCVTGAVDVEALRTVGVSCGRARQVMHGWQRNGSCAAPTDSSRTSCSARSYRCLSARTDRGLVVGCSRPGESIAFVVKRP